MNKNLLALSVAAASAMAFSASAAVSSNIVGYVKLALNTGYNLVSNPLSNTSSADGNKISKLFPIDCTVSRWTGAGFDSGAIFVDGANVIVDPPENDFVVAPGESVFVLVNGAVSVTLVGEALINTQNNSVIIGNNFLSSKIPLSGDLTALGLGTPPDNTSVSTWNGGGYDTYTYFDGLGYIDKNDQVSQPTIAVGQGMVINSLAAFVWTKTFTPTP